MPLPRHFLLLLPFLTLTSAQPPTPTPTPTTLSIFMPAFLDHNPIHGSILSISPQKTTLALTLPAKSTTITATVGESTLLFSSVSLNSFGDDDTGSAGTITWSETYDCTVYGATLTAAIPATSADCVYGSDGVFVGVEEFYVREENMGNFYTVVTVSGGDAPAATTGAGARKKIGEDNEEEGESEASSANATVTATATATATTTAITGSGTASGTTASGSSMATGTATAGSGAGRLRLPFGALAEVVVAGLRMF